LERFIIQGPPIMPTKATAEAIQLLKETLNELDKPKGSVAAAVRMLRRAASAVGETDVQTWCDFQLGESRYTWPLSRLVKAVETNQATPSAANQKTLEEARVAVREAGIDLTGRHITDEEFNVKWNLSGGGFASVDFIEQTHAQIIRTKKGNDGTYYQHNLNRTLSFIQRSAHSKATLLYNRLAYADTPQSTFDVLKRSVDDRLLDVAPEQAEQIMMAFRAVSADDPESWSQALATCRRFIEGLADKVNPASDDDPAAGRRLGQNQHINRLWAFMDRTIESETNRELAKAHVDFVGAYLERVYRLSNKGVHAAVERLEAVKAVFHLYLVTADILESLVKQRASPVGSLINVYTASLDQLEVAIGSRAIAREILRLRSTEGVVTNENLAKLKGVGAKKLARIKAAISLERL
jgi:DNA uptake protein ComE-like DNA-binding protein